MPKMKDLPFELMRRGVREWERSGRKGKKPVYYYKLPNMKGFRSTGKTVRKEAIAFATDKLNKTYHTENKRLVFKDYASKFWVTDDCPHKAYLASKNQSLSPHTIAWYSGTMKRIVWKTCPFLKKELSEITGADLIHYMEWLTNKEYSVSQRNGVSTVLKVIFKMARLHNLITHKPEQHITIINQHGVDTDSFNKEDLDRMFGNFTQPFPFNNLMWKYLFFVEATTGMRSGEVRALKWQDINFNKGIIRIERNVQTEPTHEREHTLGTTKNKKPRVTSLPSVTAAVLKQWLEQTKFKEIDDFIFYELENDFRPIRSWTYTKEFSDMIERLGLNRSFTIDKRGYKRFNIRGHSFRHTANSILLAQGMNPALIRASFGWGSETIQEIYTKFKPESFQEQKDILDEQFANAVSDNMRGELAHWDMSVIPAKTVEGKLEQENKKLATKIASLETASANKDAVISALKARVKLLETHPTLSASFRLGKWSSDFTKHISEYLSISTVGDGPSEADIAAMDSVEVEEDIFSGLTEEDLKAE